MNEYIICKAEPGHVSDLSDIETAAAGMFPKEDLPRAIQLQCTPVKVLAAAQEESRLWVALDSDGKPVGYAYARQVDGHAHLQQMDVHPDHGRQGVGTKLGGAVLDWARALGDSLITLTTFSHIPWNAPFYRLLGFRELAEGEVGAELKEVLKAEAADGLRNRIAMGCYLDDAQPITPEKRRNDVL